MSALTYHENHLHVHTERKEYWAFATKLGTWNTFPPLQRLHKSETTMDRGVVMVAELGLVTMGLR